MKRILLLAAIHALIINQSSKNAKGRSFPADKKNQPAKESNISQYISTDKRDYATAIFLLGPYSSLKMNGLNTRQ